MKNKILLILCSLVLTACPGPEPDIDVDVNILTQYKWYARFENIDISDDYDYAWLQRGYTYLFFLEDGIGRNYTWQRSEDSDGDISRGGEITRFTYTVSGNIVHIDYGAFSTNLRLSGKELLPADGGDFIYDEVFVAQNITTDDYKYIPRKGKCGENLTFVYENDTYELRITGKGDMYDYSYTNRPWNDLYIDKVIIEDGVTSVGANAFACNEVVHPVTVDLPNTLNRIGAYAFTGCLFSMINLPESVEEIGEWAFADCEYLKKVSISDDNKLVEVGEWAFSGCEKLSFNSLSFSECLRTIGNYAFISCSVGDLKFDEGVESIGHGAFAGGLSNKELILPNTLKSIGSLAFDGGFSKIVLGAGLQELGANAFVSSTKSGKLYVNIGTPLVVDGNLIDDINGYGNEKNWTLYVPKGCTSAYSKQSPWSKFKAIVEDEELYGGKENDDENDDNENDDEEDNEKKENVDYRNLSYIIDGKTYKMVLVDGGTLAPFYIMQTELPANSSLQIGETNIGVLNSNGDGGVIKAEFRKFLDKLRDVTGIAFRLPTSAEWQYAAKGGKKSKDYEYSGSSTIDEVAWYKNNSNGTGHSVANKTANELGLYDMSGNYGEVCNDKEDDEYYIDGRVSGGCWNDKASDCKVSSWKSGSTSASKIPGTNLKELNAFDSKYITVRLVYSVPK